MSGSAIDEVLRQHVFIEHWMSGGEVELDGWQLFEASLAQQFEMVVPGGMVVGRADLLDGFSGARGAMPGVRIEIRNAAELCRSDGLTVVRYEEWQHHPSLANARVSTAAFVEEAEAPLGWSWITLHETGLELPIPQESAEVGNVE